MQTCVNSHNGESEGNLTSKTFVGGTKTLPLFPVSVSGPRLFPKSLTTLKRNVGPLWCTPDPILMGFQITYLAWSLQRYPYAGILEGRPGVRNSKQLIVGQRWNFDVYSVIKRNHTILLTRSNKEHSHCLFDWPIPNKNNASSLRTIFCEQVHLIIDISYLKLALSVMHYGREHVMYVVVTYLCQLTLWVERKKK